MTRPSETAGGVGSSERMLSAMTCAHPDCDNALVAPRKRWCSDACKARRPRTVEEKRAGAERAAVKRARRTPEQLAAADAYNRAYRARTIEQKRAYNRARYLSRPEEYAAARDRWRAENPQALLDGARLWQGRRRALKLAGDSRMVPAREWRLIVNRARGCCYYCGARALLSADHVVPLSRGGRHAIGNLVAACLTCNKRKGPQLVVEWRRRDALAPSAPGRLPYPRVGDVGVVQRQPRGA